MKKEYVVSRIEASQYGSRYVYVTFADPNDYKAGAEKQQNPFGPIGFTSSEDMMKNLSKAMSGAGAQTDSPTFKISMIEYEDMSIKVGDKITIEIRKPDSTGGGI